MKKNKLEMICEKIAFGIVFGFFLLLFIFLNMNYTAFGQIIFYETIPSIKIEQDLVAMFENKNEREVFSNKDKADNDKKNDETIEIVKLEDIDYEHIKDTDNNIENDKGKLDLNRLNDINYLKQKFYTVDSKTSITGDYFNVNKFLNSDIKIKNSNEPKILIFHSHSMEMFKDSNINDINEGIVGAGTRLAKVLEEEYGIKSIHNTESFDIYNGKHSRSGSYERMEPRIKQILNQNPSIELVIDLHRDGVNENVHLVENINGKPTAKIMFFNGICRVMENGKLKNISNLYNPYVEQNLALSFNMQKRAMEKYPDFTRKIYVNAYRYSLHMNPKSLLVEAGAQTNTKEEIYNAMDLLAEIINEVIFS